MGRKLIPSFHREHVSGKIKHQQDNFQLKEENFEIETTIGSQTKNIWTVSADIIPLIEKIFSERKIQCFSDYLIKVMMDTGKGKTKVCFSTIPYECGSSNHKRASYEQGGILAKKSQYSGVNKCILCFCSSQIKETNSNLKKIFKLVNINELLIKYENVIIIGDLKILNKTYGIMEASSIHPCIYCLAIKHELLPGSPFKFKK